MPGDAEGSAPRGLECGGHSASEPSDAEPDERLDHEVTET